MSVNNLKLPPVAKNIIQKSPSIQSNLKSFASKKFGERKSSKSGSKAGLNKDLLNLAAYSKDDYT